MNWLFLLHKDPLTSRKVQLRLQHTNITQYTDKKINYFVGVKRIAYFKKNTEIEQDYIAPKVYKNTHILKIQKLPDM